jgi:hypothetical protein
MKKNICVNYDKVNNILFEIADDTNLNVELFKKLTDYLNQCLKIDNLGDNLSKKDKVGLKTQIKFIEKYVKDAAERNSIFSKYIKYNYKNIDYFTICNGFSIILFNKNVFENTNIEELSVDDPQAPNFKSLYEKAIDITNGLHEYHDYNLIESDFFNIKNIEYLYQLSKNEHKIFNAKNDADIHYSMYEGAAVEFNGMWLSFPLLSKTLKCMSNHNFKIFVSNEDNANNKGYPIYLLNEVNEIALILPVRKHE